MPINIVNVVVIAIVATSLAGHARANADVLTVHQAVAQALAVNPDVQALRAQTDAARAQAKQSVAPSEPSVSVGFNDLEKAFDVPNAGGTSYSLTQPIAFPGKAWVNRASIDHQAESLYFQMRAKELDVANTVKVAYYQVALTDKYIELNAETKASYQAIKAAAERRYEAGAITQIDLLNAEMALYSNDNDLTDLQTQRKTAVAQLNYYLRRAPDVPVDVTPLPLKFAMPNLMTLMQAERKMVDSGPQILSAQETARAADDSYTLAKMAYLPDFQVTIGTTQYNPIDASPIASVWPHTQDYLLGVQATIPLWGFFNERQGAISAERTRAAAEDSLTSTQLQNEIALESALENLRDLHVKIANYENHLLILADQAQKLALVSYGSGKIDFQALSEAAAARRQMRHDYYGLIVNYMTSYSSFGVLIGEDL